MSERKSRRWGIYAFRQARGAPMASLGVHVDFHTPRIDLHLPVWVVSVGRIVSEPGSRRAFVFDDRGRWNGHTDDCWHHEALAIAARASVLAAKANAARPSSETSQD